MISKNKSDECSWLAAQKSANQMLRIRRFKNSKRKRAQLFIHFVFSIFLFVCKLLQWELLLSSSSCSPSPPPRPSRFSSSLISTSRRVWLLVPPPLSRIHRRCPCRLYRTSLLQTWQCCQERNQQYAKLICVPFCRSCWKVGWPQLW